MERFRAKYAERPGPLSTPCWVWHAAINKDGGYAVFRHDGHNLAHRWAYEALIAPIPSGLELDHLCRNPACVNPAHLEPVTHDANVARGSKATKTRCLRGHALIGSNLRLTTGGRSCRTCHLAACKARRQRRAA